jgi:hypothetical protein
MIMYFVRREEARRYANEPLVEIPQSAKELPKQIKWTAASAHAFARMIKVMSTV